MTRRIVLGAMIALFAYACGDDDGDATSMDMGPITTDMGADTPDMPPVLDMETGGDADAYDRTQAANARAAAASCACDPQGFETAALCESFSTNPTAVADCEDAAYRASVSAAAPTFTCRADALEAYASCLEAAACDETATETCNSTASAAFEACPDVPDGVFGDDFLACINTDVLGAASTCPEGTASSDLGEAVFTGTTAMSGWDFQALSCAGDAAPDRAFEWTAPSAGAFTFDTDGSEFDTIIALYDGCEGSELACNDDSDEVGPLRSSATVVLEADQTVVVVISGYDYTSYGNYQVNVTMEMLTEPDPAAVTRRRDALARAAAAQCACDFAPFASAAECEAFGASPAGYLTCEDDAYVANYAAAGSQVTCGAEVAETYATCLEAAACDETAAQACTSDYFFSDECLPTPDAYDTALAACVDTTVVGSTPSTCPAAAVSSTVGAAVFSGTTVLAADDQAPSCGTGGSADQVFEWTAPSDGTWVFDTVGSSFDTVLAVFDGCAGTEVDCNDDGDTADGDIGRFSRLTQTVNTGESVFLVIEGYSASDAGDFVINVTPAI